MSQLLCEETGEDISEQNKIFVARRSNDQNVYVPLSGTALSVIPRSDKGNGPRGYATGGIEIWSAMKVVQNGFVFAAHVEFLYSIDQGALERFLPKTRLHFPHPNDLASA